MTVTIDPQQGADQVSVAMDDTSTLTITVADTGPPGDFDSLTITGAATADLATATISAATMTIDYAGATTTGTITAAGFSTVTLDLGDEAGPDGDSLTLDVLRLPNYGLTVRAGAPDATAVPGDTLVWVSGLTVPVEGFETVVKEAVPAAGPVGWLALGSSMVATAWARLRRSRRREQA